MTARSLDALTLEDFDKTPVWGLLDDEDFVEPIADSFKSAAEYDAVLVKADFALGTGYKRRGYLMLRSEDRQVYGVAISTSHGRPQFAELSLVLPQSTSNARQRFARLLGLSEEALFPIEYTARQIDDPTVDLTGRID